MQYLVVICNLCLGKIAQHEQNFPQAATRFAEALTFAREWSRYSWLGLGLRPAAALAPATPGAASKQSQRRYCNPAPSRRLQRPPA